MNKRSRQRRPHRLGHRSHPRHLAQRSSPTGRSTTECRTGNYLAQRPIWTDVDGHQTNVIWVNALARALYVLLRDEEVTVVQLPSVKHEHGLSTQNACSALHAPAPAARATSRRSRPRNGAGTQWHDAWPRREHSGSHPSQRLMGRAGGSDAGTDLPHGAGGGADSPRRSRDDLRSIRAGSFPAIRIRSAM